jgi:hypothetical protein
MYSGGSDPDGGEELRHLHDRAFQPAERGGKLGRVLGAIEIEPEKARAGDTGRNAADVPADACVAGGASREAVFLAIRGRGRHAAYR